MEETYQTALTLLAVGMITVFLVLALIVVIGNVLIRITNRYSIAEAHLTTTALPTADPPSVPSAETPSLSSKQMAALVATVEFLTEGKGKITTIQKLN